MKALTLIQPWAWCIAFGGKDVENRSWSPPEAFVGDRFAIHAGKQFDHDALLDSLLDPMFSPLVIDSGGEADEDLNLDGEASITAVQARERGYYFDPEMRAWYSVRVPLVRAEYASSAIVATVRLARVVRGDGPMRYSRWHTGPVGLVLDEVRPLATPIPCPGERSFWDVPAHLVPLVLASERGEPVDVSKLTSARIATVKAEQPAQLDLLGRRS